MRNSAVILLLVGLFASCHDADTVPASVTFTEHVAPIIYSNCTICHRPDGSAHFSLVTYEDCRRNAGACAYVTREHIMPPWPADPHYTQFVGQRIMSDRDIKVLQKWADEGAPKGPEDKMPALPSYPVGSLIGTPDLRLPVQPYFLKANGYDKFLIAKVPFQLPADTFASLIEFIPGRKNIVHHINGDMVKYDPDKKKDVFDGKLVVPLSNDTEGLVLDFKELALPNDDGTYPMRVKSVVNYLPGVQGQMYPDGVGGYVLPQKGAFLLKMHYGFTGKDDIIDSSYINIFFAHTPPNRPLQEFQLGTFGVVPVEPDLVIQPNTVKPVYCRFTVPFDMSIVTINPHMHMLGKSFKAYALKPDGDTIRLISIPRWDFNWQYFYTFQKMVHIPKGSVIVAEGIYDNTPQNLNNPFSPPQVVRDRNGSMSGKDEMFQFIISYLPYQPGDENISLEPPAQKQAHSK
jgi:Copper type II ascorbate-dependent monooxygenase, C-terminal domain